MSPSERLRWAVAPDHRRSTMLLWGGLAALLAAGGILTGMEASPLAGAILYLVMVSAWFVAGCGMVGYMRWFFRQSADEARRLRDLPPKD